MTGQSWDRADYRCGSCGHKFTATTQAEYIERVTDHRAAHDLVEGLRPNFRRDLARLLPELTTILRNA